LKPQDTEAQKGSEMLTPGLVTTLRDAVPSIDSTARAKLDDYFLDLADAVHDVEHPALPWRIVGMIATKVHSELVNAEIATIRAARSLPPLPAAAERTTIRRHDPAPRP
jgi:hypothetical protein